MRRCPRCQVDLTAEPVEGVLVEGCPTCAGIWFDEKELTKAAQSHRGALLDLEDHFRPQSRHHDGAAKAGGPCPNCGSPLFCFELKHSKGIVLDGCRTCRGIWVDEGELRALSQKIEGRAEGKQKQARTPVGSTASAVASFLTKVSCPICSETNPASALICWRCQAVLKGRRGAMLCPDCNGRLLSQDWGELTLDRCQSCGGLWLSDQSLAKLLQQGPPCGDVAARTSPVATGRFALLETSPPGASTPPPLPSPGDKLCPVCHCPLFRYQYAYSSGIHLDKCRSCEGVWVDGGELDAIAKFLAWAGR